MRVENVTGAGWAVDDEEYNKRRAPRGVGSTIQSIGPSPTLTPQTQSSWVNSLSISESPTMTPQTPSIIDQVRFDLVERNKLTFDTLLRSLQSLVLL